MNFPLDTSNRRLGDNKKLTMFLGKFHDLKTIDDEQQSAYTTRCRSSDCSVCAWVQECGDCQQKKNQLLNICVYSFQPVSEYTRHCAPQVIKNERTQFCFHDVFRAASEWLPASKSTWLDWVAYVRAYEWRLYSLRIYRPWMEAAHTLPTLHSQIIAMK